MGNAGCCSDGKAPGVPEERPPARPLAARKGKAANAFDQLDTDGDGFISSTELRKWAKDLPPAHFKAFFKSLDVDGDGRISFKEFQDKFYPLDFDFDPEPVATASAQPDLDGLWLMEWDGPFIRSRVSNGRFEAMNQRFKLEMGCNPLQFQWPDGSIQELKSETEKQITWLVRCGKLAGQTLCWVRIPSCPVNSEHWMELRQDKAAYSCSLCSLQKDQEWFWKCRCCDAISMCPRCAPVPPEPVFGVSAAFALEVFPDLARDHLVRYGSGSSNPNFYEIAPVLAYGPNGLGYGKTCLRDGKPNCSLVDAVHETHRGKVTHFVSWCWAYKLNDFVSALRTWAEREKITASEVYLWVCFFCNNQYRMLESQTQTGSDVLKGVFEDHLVEAGRMLLLMDTFVEPVYITRAWCIFESFVCIDKKLPMTIILPESAEVSFSETLNSTGGFTKLQKSFEEMDVRYAEASNKADQDMIRKLILTTRGYDVVNEAVKRCLLEWLTTCFHDHFLNR